MMHLTKVALSAAALATIASAAPTGAGIGGELNMDNGEHAVMPRAAYPSVPMSKYRNYALWGWGPLENGKAADLIILDGDLESASTISSLRSQGKFVVCYMSAGTVEHWRGDANKFGSNEQAKKYKGYEGKETWLDITQWEQFKAPMADRIRTYAGKGCQAVELDNIDCYNNMCVPGASYDTLVKKQVEYVSWLADAVHASGMSAGMKNAVELIPQLGGKMEFAINEQCQQYGQPKGAECGLYNQFTSKDKLVVGVEYDNNGGKVCEVAKQYKMLTKYRNGGSWANCF